MKNTISEIGILLGGLNSRLDTIKEKQISEIQDIAIESIQTEMQTGKKENSRNKQVEISTTTKTEPKWPTGKN